MLDLDSIRYTGELRISGNKNLKNLQGIHNIDTINFSLHISYNDLIEGITELSGLKRIGWSLEFANNINLKSLTGLENIKEIPRHLGVSGNPRLKNLIGLENIKKAYSINIENNDSLSSIIELSSMKKVDNELFIRNNSILKSLRGLDSIDLSSAYIVMIEKCPTLSVCHVKSICDFLALKPAKLKLDSNMKGCSTKLEVINNCTGKSDSSSNGFYIVPSPEIKIYPNPTTGILIVDGIDINRSTVSVFDITGKVFKSGVIENHTLDISDLENGIYFLRISTSEKVITSRIIKQ